MLSFHLNVYKLSVSRTAAGRLFYTTGPTTEKAHRQISFLSLEQYSQCQIPSGGESVRDHCCTPAQSVRNRLNLILYMTGNHCSFFKAGIRGHAATIPEVRPQCRRISPTYRVEFTWSRRRLTSFAAVVFFCAAAVAFDVQFFDAIIEF